MPCRPHGLLPDDERRRPRGDTVQRNDHRLDADADLFLGPVPVANPSPAPIVQNEPTCDAAHPCDDYTLTVTLPADYQATHPTHVIRITSTWPPLGGGV